MNGDLIPSITAIVVLILLSGYFSATETAFTSLNRVRVKNLAEKGNKKAKKVLTLSDHYDDLLSTILIGNNLVNIAMTSVATVMFIKLCGSYGATVATIVITIVVLIFGEITPKSMAKESPERFSMFSSSFIAPLKTLFTPLNFIFKKWKQLVARIFKSEDQTGFTEDELLTIVEEAETGGSIDEEQSELIQNAIEFNDMEAGDVLTPRVDVEAIENNTPKEEILKIFRRTGFSRLPVYDDEIDHVIGVLNQKDFHNYIYNTNASIDEYIKPVLFIPASMNLQPLLKKLQQSKTHIAVVIDEYGGMEGIVTMEDIIEELVGEIFDEHDPVSSEEVMPLYDGSYRVKAGMNIEKLMDFFDIDEEWDPVTVNGWVVRELDKLAETGDKFERRIKNKLFKVRVTKADERKALEINLKVEELPDEDEDDSET